MKSNITLVLLASMAFLSSCTTTNFDVNKSVAAMDATIPAAVRLTVSSNPKSRPYFRAVTVVVDQFALGQTFNPVALNEVISNTSIQATPEALAAIDSAVSLYKIFYDDVVALKLDQVKNLRPLLVALSTDIAKGISLPGFAHKAN